MEEFVENFNKNCTNENRLLYIVGNKCETNTRQVSFDQGKEFAESYGFEYFETSAKTG